MPATEFNQLVTDLLSDAPPRVWSLLVTMFGDLVLGPQARLSGVCVNALTAAIGIKPEATRVALHRLRKEGWIESHRTGRQSHYGLTGRGRAETEAARERVYATRPPDTQPFIILDDPSSPLEADARAWSSYSVRIGSHAVVTTHPAASSSDWAIAVQADGPVPQWVSDKLCPPEIQTASQALAARLSTVARYRGFEHFTLLQRVALRELVLHEWRRIVLRVPEFPDALFSDRWQGPACRALFAELLDALPRPEPAALEQHVGGA